MELGIRYVVCHEFDVKLSIIPSFYLFSCHNVSHPSRDLVAFPPKCVGPVTWSDCFPVINVSRLSHDPVIFPP